MTSDAALHQRMADALLIEFDHDRCLSWDDLEAWAAQVQADRIDCFCEMIEQAALVAEAAAQIKNAKARRKARDRGLAILSRFYRWSPQTFNRMADLGEALTLAERSELLLPDIPLGQYHACFKYCVKDDGDLDVTAWVKAVKWIIETDPTLPQLKAYFGEVKEEKEPGITIENVGIIQAFGEQQPILTMPADDRLPENATATVTVKVEGR